MICNEGIEHGSPEWVKRKEVSNSLRIANKAGVNPKKIMHAPDALSPNERINLRKEIKNNGFYNGGLKKLRKNIMLIMPAKVMANAG